jgi:hypothetical protein
MFMTPHIVRQYEKMREILDRKLKDRDNYIEKNFGGEDPYRDQRDDIIRHLPDEKELVNRKVEASINLDEDQDTTKKAAPPAAVAVPVQGPATQVNPPATQNAPSAPGASMASPENMAPATISPTAPIGGNNPLIAPAVAPDTSAVPQPGLAPAAPQAVPAAPETVPQATSPGANG